MRLRSIFLLFFSILSGNTLLSTTTTDDEVYKTFINSKKLFHKPSNASMDDRLYLNSFDPSFKVNGIVYYFTPESIGWAAYDYPQDIDLSRYNKSCLTSWTKKYNTSVEDCMMRNQNSANETTSIDPLLLCKVVSRPNGKVCDTRSDRLCRCMAFARWMGDKMDKIVYPDGRSITFLVWNCPGYMDSCSGYGCHTYVPSISIESSHSSSSTSTTTIYIILKVVALCALICALLSFFIRYYAYLQYRAQVQVHTRVIPVNRDTPFPHPAMSYPPPVNPLSTPPSYMAPPPPYSEKPIEPVSKVN